LQKNISYHEVSAKVSQRLISEGKEIKFEICLVPLSDVYLLDTGGKQKLYVFSLIALIILVIGSINFMNLATARSISRSKEIGIRKVAGAHRSQVIKQFMGESLLLTFIAACFAIVLAEMFLSHFNEYTGKQIVINFSDFHFIFGLIGIIILTGVLAGMYPALFLSSFRPANILKDQIKAGSGKTLLRKSLVVLQFVLSIFFIICTIIMSDQVKYIRNFNLGMNKDNIFYVNLEGDIRNKYSTVKNELLKNPAISYITSASQLPNVIRSGSYFQWGVNDDRNRRMCHTYVDCDYLETFEMEMAAGRFYDKKFSTDLTESIIVNETAIKKIGLKSPVGKPFYYINQYYNLIGIVKDFQHNSPLNIPPEPLTILLRPEGNKYLFIKINPNVTDIHTITETTNFIKSVCDKFSPNRPLEYSFLNDFSYNRERTIQARQKIIFYSTILAIFISCLGLFGLSSLMNKQRTKEIGIRKVLGASLSGIFVMLSKEFAKWVLIANIIAWPIAYFVMTKWLQNFAYRTNIGWWTFLLAGIFALVIALLTVSYQAIRAALANPVNAMRYE